MDDRRDLDVSTVMLQMLNCALHQKKIEAAVLDHTDEDELFRICRYHGVSALASLALADEDEKWQKERYRAVRREALFDNERRKIISFFEENQIAYCLLKGLELRKYYPEYGCREMDDNDLLIDESKADMIRQYMLSQGYSIKNYGKRSNDSYYRKPVFYFEMHRSLFTENEDDVFYSYFREIREKLIRKNDDSYEYRFSDEDFYIYMLAHLHKHLSEGGSGIRSLIDIYLFILHHEDLDWVYIDDELKTLGIYEEAVLLRQLSDKLFSGSENQILNADEKKMLEYIIASGLRGNRENQTINTLDKIRRKGSRHYKAEYIRQRIFLPEDSLKNNYPFFYQNRWARPFLAVYRIGRSLIFHRDHITSEISVLSKKDNND